MGMSPDCDQAVGQPSVSLSPHISQSAPLNISGPICLSSQRNVDYSVKVDTTDIRGNGTDGRAFLTLHGARGNTSEIELSSYSDTLFERGSSTDFSLNAPDVGLIESVTVRLVRMSVWAEAYLWDYDVYMYEKASHVFQDLHIHGSGMWGRSGAH
jgi:hypothetical protein